MNSYHIRLCGLGPIHLLLPSPQTKGRCVFSITVFFSLLQSAIQAAAADANPAFFLFDLDPDSRTFQALEVFDASLWQVDPE